MTKYQIGVIGSRKLNLDNEKDKTAWDFAYKVGFSLGRAVNVIVLTCGMSGVAEAASKGAKEAGGVAVNLVPGFFKEEGSDEASVRIATLIENKEKSLPIVYSSDCLIALGGGEETGMQISQAVDLGLHVVIYSKAGGISSEVFTNLEPAFQKMRSSQLVYLVESPKEAVELAKKFAKEKISKNQRIEINEELQLSNKMQIITNEIQL
ncbi:MAG: hypothetical protein U9O98_05570, partial [Asgard group archaeon]|nr:hypothetical protein [Asgard group archaeon]